MVKTNNTKAVRDESKTSRRRLNFILTSTVHAALSAKGERDGGMTVSDVARRYIVDGLRADGLL